MARSADVGRTLNVRFTAKCVDAAPGDADVAEQQLHDTHGAAVLAAVGVLRLTERVEDRARLVGAARRRVDVPDLQHDVLVHAGHFRHDVGRVAGVVAGHDVEDAHRIRERFVSLHHLEVGRCEVGRSLVVDPCEARAFGRIPLFLVVDVVAPGFVGIGLRFRIPAREEPRVRIELVVLAKEAGGVREGHDVVAVVELLREDVVDEAAVESKVAPRTDASVNVGLSGRTRKARVDHDPGGAALLRTLHPTRGERVVFNVVRADRQDDVGVLEVAPVRRHRTAAETRRETRDGRAVAHARLVVDRDDAEGAHEFLHQPAFFIVELRGAERRDAVAAVDGDAVFLFHKACVARRLDAAGDAFQSFFPGNALPLLLSGTANERIEHAVRMQLGLAVLRHHVAKAPHGGALRAETAEVDRVIRVSLEIDQLAVASRADGAAAPAAVAADIGGLLDIGKFVDLFLLRSGECAAGEGRGETAAAQEKASL